jgi:hypothetical protein
MRSVTRRRRLPTDDTRSVEASALFLRLAAEHPGVELWPDAEFTEDGWSYALVISRFDDGSDRNVRVHGSR